MKAKSVFAIILFGCLLFGIAGCNPTKTLGESGIPDTSKTASSQNSSKATISEKTKSMVSALSEAASKRSVSELTSKKTENPDATTSKAVSSTIANPETQRYGRASGNWFVAEEGDWIYYFNGLFLLEELDAIKTNDFSSAPLIFSYNQQDDGLYKVNKNGSNNTLIKKGTSWNLNYLNVLDGWIYFEGDGGIYKMKTDGNNLTKLTDQSNDLSSIVVVNNWVYGTNSSNNLCRVSINGTDYKRISEEAAKLIYVDKDYIYYISLSDSSKLYRIKTDGTSRQKLSDDTIGVAGSVNTSDINYFDGNIYYINRTDKNIYKIKNDGSGKQKIIADSCDYINVFGGYVYYQCKNDNNYYSVYRTSCSGTGKTLVTNEETNMFGISSSFIILHLHRELG